ncbi:unnamed protein product (macronuclear) [Paramecium tetraurelia]|uniref:Uncharacterized protein n=1 Tax=Paramecium tetraurelia TaxID=5888 RepID=A0C1R1_PARTE|nr:uncharacterized protein GSPATT00034205001 [Paramecium tetraurelia]CAK64728.1 unnamed protein product [Paramecium tetraurelia]|eukprot:XP_001432125.1 hypothetical protein (macronuclear) [Paramecium tetraurelia strain d4-2]
MIAGTRVNPYFQSNRRGGSALKGGRLENNSSFQTPKMVMQNSAEEKLQNKQQDVSQLRQSPSFKLKNTRFLTPGKQEEQRKQSNIQETYARKTRITVLESFYHQLGTDDDISVLKNTQQAKRKLINITPSSQTAYISKKTQELEEENIEEAHFQFVQMQQKYKQWLENFEKKCVKQF